jgi:hypothetical protein
MLRSQSLKLKELDELKRQRTLAVERLKQYLEHHPVMKVLQYGEYPDGSIREEINDMGGTVSPSFHVWRVGRAEKRDVYIYEDINWSVYSANPMFHKVEDLDVGTYGLAVSNPVVAMYHNQGLYIGSVDDEDLDKIDWSLELVIEITDLLMAFYTPEDTTHRMHKHQNQHS